MTAAAVDLLLGSACAGCALPGAALCSDCRIALAGPVHRWQPSPRPSGLPAVFAASEYAGAARAAIVAHKEHARLVLSRHLGRALALAVLAVLADSVPDPGRPVVLVPPAVSRASVRSRGDDPMRRITIGCSRVLRRAGVAVGPLRALVLRRAVADQSGLSADARADNLRGAFAVRRRAVPVLARSTVVIVDDVATTGATLGEAARVLSPVAARVAGCAVVAGTTRWAAAGT